MTRSAPSLSAAAVRVAITYNGVLTNDLQLWGYPVTGRVSNGNGRREEEPAVEEA
ncbi:MAG: hypothetical protein WAS33_09195 [Candidatus Promineifilaceae bacterium]|nr:hypothetical protein [Anaerolineaceae bacterium]